MLSHVTLFQPSAIDNAMSTVQIIHKLINEMNIIIDEVNNIDSKANEYTDEQIALLKSELSVKFDEIEVLINSLSGRIDTNSINIQDLYSRIADLRQIVINNTSFLDNKIDNVELSLTNQMQQAYTTLWHYIDSKVDILEKLIESLKETKVFNIYGRKSSIQNALDDIYKIMNPHTDITINQLLTIIDNGQTYWGSVNKYFKDITIYSIEHCAFLGENYLGGDLTTSNYLFCKLIVRTDFNNLIKTPFYNFLVLLINSATYQWTSEAQSQTPTMITNIWRNFNVTFGYPTWNNAIYLNSTYNDYNNDTPI